MIKSIIVAIGLCTTALFSMAQLTYMKDPAATQELSRKVTDLFYVNQITEAFGALKASWPMPENELSSIEDKTVVYLNLVRERFGKPIGTLKVRDESIADIALRETYLIRFENTAIRLIFTYYLSDKGWLVNAFKWDDSFSEEFR